MAVNKVVYGNTTLIDLTQSSLSDASQLARGVTAYDRTGNLLTGTLDGGVNIGTASATGSNYPTSLSFTGLQGEPKAFMLRSTSQISSSGSTTYYYIIAMVYDGSTTEGTLFRIGSTRRVQNQTTGYSWTYSNGTLTVRSSASSRSSTPGAFNNTYELVYIY